MSDFVSQYYEWVKSFHVIFVIAWMAGLLYLPRLFVYHTQVKPGGEADEKFKMMEKKLLRGIMNPSMIIVIILGLMLSSVGYYTMLWFKIKSALTVFLVASHMMMGKYRKDFERGENKRSERFYRIFNEVPAILMIIIVILVIVKP